LFQEEKSIVVANRVDDSTGLFGGRIYQEQEWLLSVICGLTNGGGVLVPVLVVKVDVVVLVDFAIAVHAVLFCSTDSLKRKCSVKLVTANAARECTTFLLFRRWGFDLPESAGGN
jgi:hypothetical protein